MRTTVRGYFIALTVAVLAPALALTAGLLWWSVGTQREHLERVLRDDAETLSQALDREMRVAIAALETLRHSDALQRGDMTGFAEAARRVHADHPHWLTIVLTRSDGQQVMNLAAEPGQSLPNISNSEVIQGALKGRPSISELIVGRVVNVHLVGIHVPVVINSEIRYALGLSSPAAHFQHLLQAYPAAVGAITGIVDQKGIIVARSLEPEKGIGTPTAPMWMAARQSERGIVRGTGRLNIPVVGAYARSDLSRWMTIVSVPASQFNEPRDQALLAVIGAHAKLSEDDGKAPPLSVLGNETILVVEDDEDVRAFIAETLMELNYTIIQAQDADSALRALDRHAIDLLLTDVVLPGMNGKELALQALARNSKLKVLFMTGYSRNAVVHHGRLDAGVELIQKPLTQASLSHKVRRVLDRARSP